MEIINSPKQLVDAGIPWVILGAYIYSLCHSFDFYILLKVTLNVVPFSASPQTLLHRRPALPSKLVSKSFSVLERLFNNGRLERLIKSTRLNLLLSLLH